MVSIAEAISLGIVEPPGEADIVSMEAQSFGVPLSYGGPYCGVIAAKEKYLRQMPGRLVGETVDKQGRRGFVPDALHARAAHPPREGDLEHLHQPGAGRADGHHLHDRLRQDGLRELAMHNLAKAQYAAAAIREAAQSAFRGSPRFNEFVVQTSEDPYRSTAACSRHKMIGGLPLRSSIRSWATPACGASLS